MRVGCLSPPSDGWVGTIVSTDRLFAVGGIRLVGLDRDLPLAVRADRGLAHRLMLHGFMSNLYAQNLFGLTRLALGGFGDLGFGRCDTVLNARIVIDLGFMRRLRNGWSASEHDDSSSNGRDVPDFHKGCLPFKSPE